MSQEEITNEVVRLIRQEMPDVEGDITPDSTFEGLGMDSLTRVDLLAAVERTFELEVPDDAVASLLRVRDLTDFLHTSKAAV
ncbi:phosphopantetheine-binding protein [Phytohabitans sp. ZYX-F-186]|uniref:Phosphopantetheine-binding protein n=1 Tax=Phytohabitans maris TaxID=3071409 RepID=A0ABU0ZCH4_9ACTN|nr:phosphopantetheine-binding protein [Phytohabitans sp. ZYX-F-186]MDQ7903622.1 phosphopantetheine-binding protein [Phytohabitans sp. ZYX-F-186]